jgi:hypothetical protein
VDHGFEVDVRGLGNLLLLQRNIHISMSAAKK